MNLVRAGFFSLTSTPPGGDEAGYLRWHALDHEPEQHTIPGILAGTRWRADDGCVTARAVATPALAEVRHAMAYLIGDPEEQALRDFAALGARLRSEGRYPVAATAHLLGAYELVVAEAAPSAAVSAGAVPFRPHRGVYLVVEEGQPAADRGREALRGVLEEPGVAGVLRFAATSALGRGSDQGRRFGIPAWDPAGRWITVVYVDGDVLEVSARVEPRLRRRWGHGVTPELAGPFRSMVAHEAWPAEP